MQSIIWTSRLFSRALVSGLTTYCAEVNLNRKRDHHLISAVSGIPKEFSGGKIRHGQFGDDAYFVAKYKAHDVIGVADGVGGWRTYGIDPGEFSSFLMKTCERLVTTGRFTPDDPADLLARSYAELQESKEPILGSSTACVIVFNRETSTIYTANIGDSGFLVVRKGVVVHRSEEQQHYFNTPYQLSMPPPGHHRLVLSDSPDSADTSNFQVEEGDVIVVATDGVFDNLPDNILIEEVKKLHGVKDPVHIQRVANSIAWMARSLAFDDRFMSPFAQHARANGIDAIGGKPDDITILLATVALEED